MLPVVKIFCCTDTVNYLAQYRTDWQLGGGRYVKTQLSLYLFYYADDMFRSTTIIRELQCPCQSHYYLTTVVCILSVVVWQHIILFGLVCA